jgi:3-hydroxybutyryl-CoA dehydratase
MTHGSESGKDGFAALTVGKKVTVRKTVSESDVYMFAGITGDLGPNHVDEEYMRGTPYGRRIAHGALAIGLMSNASTKITDGLPGTIVSYGYDRIRFPAPIFIGDTVTVTYEIVERDEAAMKTFARVTCVTQEGATAAIATHILKVVT